MRIVHYGLTNKGGRPVNEDCIGSAKKGGAECFILCDGLGGHGMGDKASQLVTRFAEDGFRSCTELEDFVSSVLILAHTKLTAEQQKMGLNHKMLTTAVILVIDGDKGIAIHIGDSRLYRFRNGSAIWRTRDHSVPQMLVMTGEIEDKDIRCHPDRSRLLRALGDDSEAARFDTERFDVREGDAFLLCSDGFWEPVTEEQMCASLAESGSPRRWMSGMKKLVKQYNRGKDGDNYSAIAVMIKG